MDSWTFAQGLDSWRLALECVALLRKFLSVRFYGHSPGGIDPDAASTLEAARLALLRRFRSDTSLLNGVLQCVTLIPTSALKGSLQSQAGAYAFLRHLGDLQTVGQERILTRLSETRVLPLPLEYGYLRRTSGEQRSALVALACEAMKVKRHASAFF
jgi:hypothetical protein